jgi:hypothetical protein
LSAQAANDTQVPARHSRVLFEAVRNLFPESQTGFNHSESVMVDAMYCVSNSDEFRCTGKTIAGKELDVSGGNPADVEANRKLNSVFQSMKRAHFPFVQFKGGKYVSLVHLYCDHNMPARGYEGYECSWKEASDQE